MLATRVIASIRNIEMYLPPISHSTCHNSELQLGHQVYNVFRLTRFDEVGISLRDLSSPHSP